MPKPPSIASKVTSLPVKRRKPPTSLSVRQECALRFATAMIAGKYGEAILETPGPQVSRRWALRAYEMADAFLAQPDPA